MRVPTAVRFCCTRPTAQIGLLVALTAAVPDARASARVTHGVGDLLAQRVFAIAFVFTANRRSTSASLRFEAPADVETRSLMGNVGQGVSKQRTTEPSVLTSSLPVELSVAL